MCHGSSCRYKNLANRFALIPKKMVSLHNQDISNLADFLLHELCAEEVFNIKKAAFLVDNPDFDFIQGISGFERAESYERSSHWDEPKEFVSHVHKSNFNNKVKSFCKCSSVKKTGGSYNDFVEKQSNEFGFSNPKISVWDLKYYNSGIMMYELNGEPDDSFNDHFENILYMLGFCSLH